VSRDIGHHPSHPGPPGEEPERVQLRFGEEIRVLGLPSGETGAFVDLGHHVPAEGGVAEPEALRIGRLEEAGGRDALAQGVPEMIGPGPLDLGQSAVEQGRGDPLPAGATRFAGT
jgi:hypothetical protein